jgi:branched-chain amino acid aminotransferase
MEKIEKKIWIDGVILNESQTRVPILTHSLQYGSGIFEGIRSYKTNKGTAVFRLEDHVKRFINSAKIMNMDLNFNENQISKAILQTIKENKLTDAYIRPFAFYNNSEIGLGVSGKKISVAIAAVYLGNYFAGKNKGIQCAVSSWQRINPLVLPTQAKASGNYANSILASMEAKNLGVDEAILLSAQGMIAEGPGENIFLVKEGKLLTPSKDADILLGITRDSIIAMAKSIGLEVEERQIHKEELYTCDELFFCGTAAEITPIISVDSRKVGDGKVGKLTIKVADMYSKIVHGEVYSFKKWLTEI